MFQSITYLRYDSKTKEYIYEITDDDFVCEAVDGREAWATSGAAVAFAVAIAEEYKRRSLNVAKNLALLILWYHNHIRGSSIKDLTYWQDKNCSEYISEWDSYIKERDDYLNTLLLFS